MIDYPWTQISDAITGGLVGGCSRPVANNLQERQQLRKSPRQGTRKLRKASLDYYATIRGLYQQCRQDEISNGAPPLPSGVGLDGEATAPIPSPPAASFLAIEEPIGIVPSAYDR